MAQHQKKAKLGGNCGICQLYYGVLTVDHVIPASIVNMINPEAVFEDEENFALVCQRCNKYKSCRIDALNPKTKPLLLKYVSQLPDGK